MRRRRALATLAVYLLLACSALCLAEKWTAIEAAYYATASLTTVRSPCILAASNRIKKLYTRG